MIAIAATLLFLSGLASPNVPPATDGPVVVIPFEGQLSESLVALTVRSLREAQESGAQAVIFAIDTPGGEVTLMDRITREIEKLDGVTTIAYVVQKAASAGALIAITCDRLYMTEGSSIGSARPIWRPILPIPLPEPVQDQQKMERDEVEEKIISSFRAHFRAKAQRSNRSEALAEAMVDQEIVVYEVLVDGVQTLTTEDGLHKLEQLHGQENVQILQTVCDRGQLLNMTAREALDLRFIDGVASTLDDVLTQAGLNRNGGEPVVVQMSMSWSESLVGFIQGWGLALLLAGIIAMVVELKVPGFGVPGIIGIVCLTLFLFGKYLAGLAELTEILLIVAGVVLIAVEIFVVPGTLISGIAGALLVGVGVVLSFQSIDIPTSSTPWAAEEWWSNLTSLSVTLASSVVAIIALATFLPHIPLLGRAALRSEFSSGRMTGSGAVVDDVYRGWQPEVGSQGRTASPLRPAGKVDIGGREVDAVAEGQFVETGSDVVVSRVEGNRIVVRPVS